jgi:hypothetical protein
VNTLGSTPDFAIMPNPSPLSGCIKGNLERGGEIMVEPSIALLATLIVIVGPLAIGFLIMGAIMIVAFFGSLYALLRHGVRDYFDESLVRKRQRDRHGGQLREGDIESAAPPLPPPPAPTDFRKVQHVS